jgi:hypothetical protein
VSGREWVFVMELEDLFDLFKLEGLDIGILCVLSL